MTLTSPTSTPASLDALAPLRLPAELRLTPEQFEQVCAENREAVLELASDGRVITMTPTGSETGARNSRLLMRLLMWADQYGGWKVFDSSTGFRLPDGAILSPDASLVRLERWQALTAEQRRTFAPLCPDLVVELASPSDEGPRGVIALRRKMAAYRANGARLGWLMRGLLQALGLAAGRPDFDSPLGGEQQPAEASAVGLIGSHLLAQGAQALGALIAGAVQLHHQIGAEGREAATLFGSESLPALQAHKGSVGAQHGSIG